MSFLLYFNLKAIYEYFKIVNCLYILGRYVRSAERLVSVKAMENYPLFRPAAILITQLLLSNHG